MDPTAQSAPRRALRTAFASLALAAAALLLVGPGAGRATAGGARVTAGALAVDLYAAPSRKAFVNNHDDLARGEGHNPFGNYVAPPVPPPTNEKDFGPFAGDEGEFAFKLFGDAAHRKPAGTAIFICQYNFNEGAFCDASFQLAGGTVTAKGTESFNAQSFTLAVLGGTNDYRGVTGQMTVTASGIATQTQPAFRAVPLLQANHVTARLGRRKAAASGAADLTRYSAPTHANFVNNDDDEARGDVNNPWGIHNTRGAANKENGNGPFPGDEAIFTFDVYAASSLRGRHGPAIYTCQYYFYKNAFCDATFQLPGGVITAAGIVNFNARTFVLTVTGGSGSYLGQTGELRVAPHGKQAQQLSFDLT